jgi:hypothetical protein
MVAKNCAKLGDISLNLAPIIELPKASTASQNTHIYKNRNIKKIVEKVNFEILENHITVSAIVNKSQELTLDNVVVSLEDREFALEITYVALSRVRRFEDIMFDTGFNVSRLDNIKNIKLWGQRLNEESRLKKLM